MTFMPHLSSILELKHPEGCYTQAQNSPKSAISFGRSWVPLDHVPIYKHVIGLHGISY